MPPLLFLDVDGPLIPFGGAPEEYPAHGADDANPLLRRIDPAHGPRLAALPCELVWATTWEEEANEYVAPRLHLPRLPVVVWPEPTRADEEDDERHGLHWKTQTLVSLAAGRPFAWVDDELTDADRRWVAARHPGPALLHRVDPRRGLTEGDFAALRSWLLENQVTSGRAGQQNQGTGREADSP
ncbi:HAD domain-containing protein [Kitasatospora albolonga]|uniref:HAD domain-containing protein n=1 Tax=Kitasatospora albolonga TaxID=68173 RepID=UPI0031EA2C97